MNYVFKDPMLKHIASHLENYVGRSLVVSSSLGSHYDLTFNVDHKPGREFEKPLKRFETLALS